MIKFIENIGDFFSSNYFDEDFVKKVHDKSGYSSDDYKGLQKRISPLKDKYFKYKQSIIEGRLRTKDKIFETHQFHTQLLNSLGYEGERHNYESPFHLSEKEVIPIRHILYKGDKPHLMIMEIQPLIREGDEEPDGLFEQRYNEDGDTTSEQRYHRSQWSRVFEISKELKISPAIINKCISELSLLDQSERPHYIMVLGGNMIYLIEVEKWFRGSYLSFDIEELFFESTVDRRYYSLFYLLLSKEMLSPDSELVLMDQLDEDSHKSAYEVTKDLKEGIINAVELLANESLHYQKEVLLQEFDESDDTFEQEVKDDCLNIIYRLLFVFYAESRPDLDILPISDQVYQKGYSLEMLRDLEQTQLITDHSRNGYFFHESLSKLFELMSSGYREDENGRNKSFKIRHIDSPLFDNKKLNHLGEVKFRNYVWQDVICQLSLSKKKRNKPRGRISYANLGINQLGSVYESLLAYRGFYAEEDYIEVHTKNKPKDGTYLVPRSRRDDFHRDEVLTDENDNEVIIQKGRFVYRLSGRDRQKSASYYTPEVLTQCTVKYTLKSILEKVEQGEMSSLELLDLKLLEPAMGAAAFHNELINQLSEAYLNYRQREVKKKISPEKYREELQRVKAYIATNNTYGVDLNPTAIELGKLSLWLNVIHKDMETPFFANRLAVGNAVVGAWFKTFTTKELKKKWWDCEPKMVSFENGKINRSKKQIYHFLLPDKNMVPSAGIKLLKDEDPDRSKRVSDWKKEVCKPISETEIQQLQKICESIDSLVLEYFEFQKRLNLQTKNKLDVWEGVNSDEQVTMNLRSYDEKEQLNDQRNRQSAPYYKLKMVMDYWCSLWFWDMRNAEFLPSRQQYLNDVSSILNVNLSSDSSEQLGFGFEESTLGVAQTQIIQKTEQSNLFDDKERLSIVKDLSVQNRFFHSQLEFIEVFLERGGFDLIVGNPPWVNITMDQAGVVSEIDPTVFIRKMSSPKVRKKVEFLINDNPELKKILINEELWAESTKEFLGSTQNYYLLQGQRNNLYKCILVNTFSLSSPKGYSGLVHPEGIYDDPKGSLLRKQVYQRLKYHFEIKNGLLLFKEVHDQMSYGINIYSGVTESPSFYSMHNIFHPQTIHGSFNHTGIGTPGGIKIKDSQSDNFTWNLKPHKNRIIRFTSNELKILNETFENIEDPLTTKMVGIHSKEILSVIKKIGQFKSRLKNFKHFTTLSLNETNSPRDGLVIRKTVYPIYDEYQMIYSGPHFFVSNPLYKTPREQCRLNSDYDTINLNKVGSSFLPRTNFTPNIDKESFKNLVGSSINWIDQYRVCFSKMISVPGERTLQPAIIPPKFTHMDGVISTWLDHSLLVEFCGLSSSIVMDFYIKSLGKGNLYDDTLKHLVLGIDDQFRELILSRTLLLNSLTEYYKELWGDVWDQGWSNQSWSKQDNRLLDFSKLNSEWKIINTLRNFYERRLALVEIDVLTSMSMNMTVEELILIYEVQFPVLQQNEDDTWYDTKGEIVFTRSQGLKGIGVDRSVWESIRNMKDGETYEHTIEKSELYHGEKITYYAPFEKCDRVEDYKVAWAHFEKIFNQN
ncbi:hypothetical protein N9464_02140 [Flavobacteriaceae bacterium]|nr:hypothetical protein [Flavobacteriaceae bacterium]